MTDKDGSTHFDPKHRIIGAVVVVALAVILVPMILGEPKSLEEAGAPVRSTVETSPSTPTNENKVAVTVVTPAAESTPAPPPAITPVPKEPPVQKEPQKVAEIKPTTSAAKPAAAPTKPTTTTTAKATTSPAPVSNGWIVQVGTFSDAENASRLETKLKALGQTVRSERIAISSGKAVRVRVGPFADKVAAVKAQEKIQKEIGIKVVVLSYP